MAQPNTIVSLAILLPDPPDDVLQAISTAGYGMQQELSDKEFQAVREFKAAARKCIEQLSEKTLLALGDVARTAFAGSSELKESQRRYEATEEAWLDFWTDASKSSIDSRPFREACDLDTAEWIGCGKWGWVMRSRRKTDNKDVVVKVSDLKHANIVTKEWKYGHALSKTHQGIVDYQSVYLYGDDSIMQNKLKDAFKTGRLKGAQEHRASFPEHYVCMVQEFMNAGDVQDWIDKEKLHPTGMLVVLRSVAAALAHMHEQEVTHNDIKPENVLLSQEGDRIIVKLGDLGLAEKSRNTTSDVTRYGLSAFCMITGEKFDQRRCKPESIQAIVDDLYSACVDSGAEGDLGVALGKLPALLEQTLRETTTMAEVRKAACLKGWDFLASGTSTRTDQDDFSPPARARPKSEHRSTFRDLKEDIVRPSRRAAAHHSEVESNGKEDETDQSRKLRAFMTKR